VPVALNCGCDPFATEGVAGVTPIETSVAAVTVSNELAETAPSVAEIVVVPAARVVARPFEPAVLLIVAAATVLDAQVTCVVRSCVVASVYVPIAVNGLVNPFGTDGAEGVMPIDTSVASVTVAVVVPITAPDVAVIVDVPGSTPVSKPFVPSEATALVPEAHVTCADRS
jgi:hypothetical protein